MDATRWAAVAACAGAVLAAAGCGSGSSSATTANSATVTVTVTQTSSTSSGTGTGSSTGTTTGTSTTAGGARNLVVTPALRAQLVQAGAASNSVPAADYAGLAPGTTFYAYDSATGTYWAGARLVPKSTSEKAQVSVQDDGGYLLYSKPSGGTWHVDAVGMTGIGGAKCPVVVPAGVLALWGWKPGTCRPGA